MTHPEADDQEPKRAEYIINSDQLELLLEGMLDTERWAIVSRFYAEITVSRLADMLDVAPKHIRRLLTSAAQILVYNIMDTRLELAKSHLATTYVNSALMNALFAGMSDTQIQVLLSRFEADVSVRGIADQFDMEPIDVKRHITAAMRILIQNCFSTMERIDLRPPRTQADDEL